MIHAQGADEFWLIDLGSANGTYLNGRRIGQPTRLRENDRIEISGFVFTFRQPWAASLPAAEATNEKTIQDIKTLQCWLLVADIESSTQFAQTATAEELSRVTGPWLAVCN